MPLAHLVTHAALAAFAEAAGMSGAAHTAALGLWLSPQDPAAIAGAAALGTGAGAVISMRGRLFPALSDGARALGRPASFLTSPRAREALVLVWIPTVSAALSWVLGRAGLDRPPSPQALAIGLGVTGLALLSTGLRREPSARSRERAAHRDLPSLAGATLAGAAHALGVWPGVSRVGLAAAALLALGVRPGRALPFALAATVPFWWASFLAAWPEARAMGAGKVTLAALFGLLGALAAPVALRALAQRRALVLVPLWMIPLAGALLAYARAV